MYCFFSNSWSPRIPNSRNKKIKNTITFPSFGSDLSKELTRRRMLSIVLIERRGRKTRSTRSGLRLGMPGTNSRSLSVSGGEGVLPGNDDDKVEPVPRVAEVGVSVHYEA